MEQSPSSEANSHSATQEIPRLLRNPEVHYRPHKSLSLVPILIQMYPVHTFPPWSLKIHSNNILLPFYPQLCFWSCFRYTLYGCFLHSFTHDYVQSVFKKLGLIPVANSCSTFQNNFTGQPSHKLIYSNLGLFLWGYNSDHLPFLCSTIFCQ